MLETWGVVPEKGSGWEGFKCHMNTSDYAFVPHSEAILCKRKDTGPVKEEVFYISPLGW